MFLPEDYKIIDISVYPATEDLKVEAKVDEKKDNQVCFGIGDIFQSKEYFKYTIIAEAPKDSKEIMDLLKFKHRIPNTDKISNTFVGLPNSIRKKKRMIYLLMSYLVLFSLLSVTLFFLKMPIHFKILEKTTQNEVSIYINHQSEIFVEDCGSKNPFGSGQKISSKELAMNYTYLPQTSYNYKDLLPIFCFPLILIFMLIHIYYKTWAKHSHIIRIIMKDERKNNASKNTNIILLLKRIIQNI